MTPTNGQKATARPSIKTSANRSGARSGRTRAKAPAYTQVLGALGRDEVRTRVLDRFFKALGGDRNRWSGGDHRHIADALSVRRTGLKSITRSGRGGRRSPPCAGSSRRA